MSTTLVDSEFRARLIQVMERFGSVVALANAVGVSDNAIYKWLAGRGQPSMANLVAVARAARVSIEWLATGIDHKQSRDTITHAVERGDFVFMPRNQARFPDGREGVIQSDQVVDPLAFRAEWIKEKLSADARDLILVQVVGDSMAPTLEDSDLIIANVAEPRFRQDGIYLVRHDGGLAVKRVQRRPDGKVLVRNDNPAYEPMVVSTQKLKIVGRVIWAGGRI
jgi:phage repressor protein C with HTH and peptisase S24 domain